MWVTNEDNGKNTSLRKGPLVKSGSFIGLERRTVERHKGHGGISMDRDRYINRHYRRGESIETQFGEDEREQVFCGSKSRSCFALGDVDRFVARGKERERDL